MLLMKNRLGHPKLSDGTDVLKSFQWDSNTRNQQLKILQPKSPANASRKQVYSLKFCDGIDNNFRMALLEHQMLKAKLNHLSAIFQ